MYGCQSGEGYGLAVRLAYVGKQGPFEFQGLEVGERPQGVEKIGHVCDVRRFEDLAVRQLQMSQRWPQQRFRPAAPNPDEGKRAEVGWWDHKERLRDTDVRPAGRDGQLVVPRLAEGLDAEYFEDVALGTEHVFPALFETGAVDKDQELTDARDQEADLRGLVMEVVVEPVSIYASLAVAHGIRDDEGDGQGKVAGALQQHLGVGDWNALVVGDPSPERCTVERDLAPVPADMGDFDPLVQGPMEYVVRVVREAVKRVLPIYGGLYQKHLGKDFGGKSGDGGMRVIEALEL